MRKTLWPILFSVLFLAACSSLIHVPGEKAAPVQEDVAELGPGSLKLEVVSYQWSYINGRTHLKVEGVVVNNTGKRLHSASIQGVLHDQNGKPIAFGSSYIYPAYLAPGAQGSFEFSGLAKRQRGLENTRLVITATARDIR
ncbi:MAG: FxLYD domain-containing protein [Deltaproteobacteria bacterium]|jgi:hypothetical protein|nr:FxLYD domain-containing protein [Deltaproteobacteria bacterium]